LKVSARNPSNPQICKVQTLKFWIRKLAPDRIEFAEDPCHTIKSASFAIPSLQMMKMLTMKVVLGDILGDNASLRLKRAMEMAVNDE